MRQLRHYLTMLPGNSEYILFAQMFTLNVKLLPNAMWEFKCVSRCSNRYINNSSL